MGESEKEEKIGVKKKTKKGMTTGYELFDMSAKPWNFNPDKDLLYIDAGAWQGDENGDFRTNFVLISGNGVALCNYYKVPSYDQSNIDYLKYIGTKGEDEFKDCEPVLEFLKKIDSKKPLSHVLYFYRSTSKPFWDSNSLLIVIGDLHLHLFRQLDNSEKALLDNFIKKEDGIRKSLEEDFCDFLNKIYDYKKSGNVDVKVVQAGDILDIWEIEYVFQQVYSIDSTMLSLKFWLDEGVLLENIIPPKVNPAGLKTYIKKNVFSKICASIDNLKSLGIHFIILQGNHDDRLGNSTEFNEGPDYLVHIEHGHMFDSANEPGGDWLGRFLTKRNVDFESLGLGDWFKEKEEPASKIKNNIIYYLTFKQHLPLEQRETYIKASLDVSSWFKNKGKNLSIFIMAHTHIPYAVKKPRLLEPFTGESIDQKTGEKQIPISIILKGKAIDKTTGKPVIGARIDLFKTMVSLTQCDKNIQKYKCYSKPTTDKENKISEELDFGDYRVLEIKTNYPNDNSDFIKIKSEKLSVSNGEGWICSKWIDNQGKLKHTALLFDEKINENIAITAQDGSFNITVDEKQYYKLRIVLKDYFDGESDRITAPDGDIEIKMEVSPNNIKESDIVKWLNEFKGYSYDLHNAKYPYKLPNVNYLKKGTVKGDSLTPQQIQTGNTPYVEKNNCSTFTEALLIKSWSEKFGANWKDANENPMSWILDKHKDWMIRGGNENRNKRFSPIDVAVNSGMGVDAQLVEKDNIAHKKIEPSPWMIVQGWKNPENSNKWAKGGHSFIIVNMHKETRRMLILESNAKLDNNGNTIGKLNEINGPGFRMLGNIDENNDYIKNYAPVKDWWKNEKLKTWDEVKDNYPYLKMARLKLYDLKL